MEIVISTVVAIGAAVAMQFVFFLRDRKKMLNDVAEILQDEGPMPAMVAEHVVEMSRELIFDAMAEGDTASDIAHALLVAADPERYRELGLSDILPELD